MFTTALSRSAPEKRGSLTVYDDFWYNIIGKPSASGISVSRDTAMRQWAVYACVSLIAETIAMLPLKLKKRRADGGTDDATDHPLYDILKYQPNPVMTSFTWRETSQAGLLTGGNAFSFIQRTDGGITALWPVAPGTVEVKQPKPGGELVYMVKNEAGTSKEYPARDMLHIPGLGWNGVLGESVITNFAKETIANSLGLDEFQGKFFKNGLHASGTLEHPGTLGENAAQFKEALRKRFQGLDNVGVPMVLEDGMKWNPHKVSLVDQQFLEQMDATALQICGIFKVPPSKIGIYGKGTSYNNTEQQGKNFLDTTMLQWLVRWEQSLDVKLLTKRERDSGLFCKFNFDALLRPDAKTRAEIAEINWRMGVPLNISRKMDDLNPVEGGDVGYVPVNYAPVGSRPEGEGDGEGSQDSKSGTARS